MQQKLFQLWILPPAVDMLETHIYLFLTIWQKAANSEQQTTITTRDTIVFRHVNNVWRCCTIVGDGVLTRSSHQMPLLNCFLKEDGQVLFREISLWYCSNLSNKVKHCLHVCNTRHYCFVLYCCLLTASCSTIWGFHPVTPYLLRTQPAPGSLRLGATVDNFPNWFVSLASPPPPPLPPSLTPQFTLTS